jgi:DNA invertase Pin-like site-specific DNA recombinase
VTRPKPLRAILLARVSTNHEDQDTSPDRQLARLEALAEAHGWTVVDRIVERASGAQILDRPPVARALQRIVDYEADVLMVDHLFRLGRNVRELLEVIDVLDKAGGGFYDATHKLDTTGPFGRLIFTVLAAVGEFEIYDRRAKILEGLERARARGTRLGKPSSMSDAARARAVALRVEELDRGFPYSWNEIRKMLKAEGLGDYSRSTIVNAVGRALAMTPPPERMNDGR